MNKAKVMNEPVGQNGKGRSGFSWPAWLPLVVFLLVLTIPASFYFRQQAERRQENIRIQAENKQLGLPVDYPLKQFPLYPGAKLLKAERGDALSSEQKPMDKWYVHMTSLDKREKIRDFYMSLAEKAKMSQSMSISIPTGYAINYADERTEVDFAIERKLPDKLNHIEITIYRLR